MAPTALPAQTLKMASVTVPPTMAVYKPLEIVGGEGVDARPSRIEALRVAGRPGTPEVACA